MIKDGMVIGVYDNPQLLFYFEGITDKETLEKIDLIVQD